MKRHSSQASGNPRMHIPAGGWPLWLQQSRGGTRRVKGVVARQVKKQAPSGLHDSTGAERSLELLRRRDWPHWRYLERKNHERSSVRTGRVDRTALIGVRKAGHRSDLHPICHMAGWQKRFVKLPGCQICGLEIARWKGGHFKRAI